MSLPRFDEPEPEAQPVTDQDRADQLPQRALAAAVSAWCTARWLPADPWEPDPEWLTLQVPDLPMAPAGLSVLLALVQARTACRTTLGIDLVSPGAPMQLARVVATLNRRLPSIQATLAEDTRPWSELASALHDAETIRKAAVPVARQVQDEPIGERPDATAWRPLAARVKSLAPLVAIGATTGIDFSLPGAVQQLSGLVLHLRQIALPALVDPTPVLQLLERADAVGRIKRALGRDPLLLPFSQVSDAVEAQQAEALDQVPDARLVDGVLVGMPYMPPNLSTLINPAMLAAVTRLDAASLSRLDWLVPNHDAFPLLRVGAPILALTQALSAIGMNPIAPRPCTACDAREAVRESSALSTQF